MFPMTGKLFPVLLIAMAVGSVAALPAEAAEDMGAKTNVLDALECRLSAPEYNQFAWPLAEKGNIAAQRGWRKVKSPNPLVSEYDLPAPITLAQGRQTRRIGFTSNSIVAILDEADPAVLAKPEQIENQADIEPLIAALVATGKATRAQVEAELGFRKFMGERVVHDSTEPPEEGQEFGMHTIIAKTISNVKTHPGKTLYGCSYRMEVVDKDGNPL